MGFVFGPDAICSRFLFRRQLRSAWELWQWEGCLAQALPLAALHRVPAISCGQQTNAAFLPGC